MLPFIGIFGLMTHYVCYCSFWCELYCFFLAVLAFGAGSIAPESAKQLQRKKTFHGFRLLCSRERILRGPWKAAHQLELITPVFEHWYKDE